MRLQQMLKVYTMSSGKGRLGTLLATRNFIRTKGIRFIVTCPKKLITGI